jgi:MFS family permease
MSRRTRAAAWLVLAVALLPRLGWIGYQWQARGPALAYPDEEVHWQLARNLVTSGNLVTDDGRYAARMPAYPLFLAPFATAGPAGVLLARLAQGVLGALTAVCAYGLVSAACDPRGGLLAGLLVACDPFAVFFGNLLLTETLFTTLAMLFTGGIWLVGVRGPRTLPLLGAAVCGALVVLTRPSAAAWLPLAWVALAGQLWSRGPRRAAWCVAVCPGVLAVLLVPWGVRNQLVLGAPAWLSTNGGVTLFDAQGPQADGSSDQRFLQSMPELEKLGEVERDAALRRMALAQMRADPVRVLRLACVKLARTWSPLPNVAEYRGGWAAWAGAAYTLVLLAGAAVGMYVAFRGAPPQWRWCVVLACLPVVYFTVVHMVYIGSVRYRLPALPFLAVITGGISQRTNNSDRTGELSLAPSNPGH